MQNLYKIVISTLIGLFVFGLGVGVGHGLTVYFDQGGLAGLPRPTQADTPEDFTLFNEVWRLVDEQFYDGVPAGPQTTYGAIRGALAALEDPYTVFVEPQPRAFEKAELDGQYGGIGAFIYQDEAGIFRLNPMVDSPAEQAGVIKDDIIVKVDETVLTPEMTIDDVRFLIIGDIGTKVTLTLSREGSAEPILTTIERGVIETPSVEWRIIEEDPEIGYIRISLFSNRTDREMDRAFQELKAAGAKRYILDLRGNGGGLLQAAVDVASQFLADGVVLTEHRRGQEPKVYDVRKGGKLLDQPLVLLVDGGTASASEIVAGAIQDHQRAPLIGERTYGKGSVQLVYDLSDESSLHVTVAKWFTPNNHSIDGAGLSPDIEVLFSEEDHATGRDPQYLKAIEQLQSMP